MSIDTTAFRGRSLFPSLIAGIAIGAAALFTPAADAQGTANASATQPWPRMVVPASDGVVMRCGAGVAWYPVATIPAKSVLKADAEVDGWLRVEYLPGTTVVVKADEVDLKESEQKVVLNRRSRLRALSQADPVFEESFRPVFEEFLAPGVEMRYIGPVKSRTGEVSGYQVVPPSGAKGFVLAREVRDARPEDLAPPAQQPAPQIQPPAVTPPAATTAAVPPVQQASPPPVNPAPAESQTPVPVETAPVGEPPAAPSEVPAAETLTTPPPMETIPAPVTAPAPPVKPAGPTLRQLDRACDELLKKPLVDGDPAELIEQYHAYADSIDGKPGSQRALQYIDTRVQILKLRQDTRDLLPEIQALEQAMQDASQNYALTIDRLIQNREYLVVGRLLPSTIYDGERLPRMYRLISIDPTVNSTLAYLIPVAEHQLEQKIGSIVGVLGESQDEPSSMVRIVTPTTVDILRAAETLPPVSVP